MATYNKRGYKAPKEKEVKEEVVNEEQQVILDGKNSTTADVFLNWMKLLQKLRIGLLKIKKSLLV